VTEWIAEGPFATLVEVLAVDEDGHPCRGVLGER
jgi:hypothetical protein